jgi:hypothetical protein
MDPNDPTRIQPVAEPPADRPGAWPQPPPSPYGWSGGHQEPPTAAYPVASPPPPGPPPAGASYVYRPERPSGPSRGFQIAGGVLALLLAGLIGFIVGVQVEKGRKPATVATGSTGSATTTPSIPGQTGNVPRPSAAARGAAGVVTAVSGGGFTITLADGTQLNVVVSGKTRIVKMVAGSQSDVTPGIRVSVVGPRNQSGDITASMVTVGLARATGARGRATTTVP